jgi:hypothetical protein
MSEGAAILPRRSPKRVSVLGGWELPLRVGSEKRSAARGGVRRSGVFFWDPRWRSQNGNCLNDARTGLD